jgi:uncharacterized protein (DUF1697 family)
MPNYETSGAMYLALLRGINVGGNNIIKMDALRAVFEALGFSRVKTYIQSGNILFESAAPDGLADTIERALQKAFGCEIRVAVFTAEELRQVVEKRPPDFGGDPERYRYDVLFFIEPGAAAAEAAREVRLREGVDTLVSGERVLYMTRFVPALTKSYFSKIAGTPLYQNVTIRNWNTTKKLYEMAVALGNAA